MFDSMETKAFLEQVEEKLNKFVEVNGYYSPIELHKMLAGSDNDIDDFINNCRYSHSEESNYVREQLKSKEVITAAEFSDIVRRSVGLPVRPHSYIEELIGFDLRSSNAR